MAFFQKIFGLQRSDVFGADTEDGDPPVTGVSGNTIDVNEEIREQNRESYNESLTDSQYRRFAALYQEVDVAHAIVNKIHTLILREGWQLLPYPRDKGGELSDAEFEMLSLFYEEYKEKISKYILEGMIGGTLILYPVRNVENAQDVLIAQISAEYISDVGMSDKGPSVVTISEQAKQYRDTTTDLSGQDLRIIQKMPNGSFDGDILYFTFNAQINARYGKSILYPAEQALNGYREIVSNMITRSRLSQMISIIMKNFKLSGATKPARTTPLNRKKDEGRVQSIISTLRLKNIFAFLKGQEEIDFVTPDLRSCHWIYQNRTFESGLVCISFTFHVFAFIIWTIK